MSSRNSENDNLLSGNEFGNVNVILASKVGKTFLEDDRRDLVSGLDFFDFGHGIFGSRGKASGKGWLLKSQETVGKGKGGKEHACECAHARAPGWRIQEDGNGRRKPQHKRQRSEEEEILDGDSDLECGDAMEEE